jgi:putative endopeptidase
LRSAPWRFWLSSRAARLIDQYSAFWPLDDLAVNGEFTLGESIDDLGGISIGLLAYQMSLHGAQAPVIDGPIHTRC